MFCLLRVFAGEDEHDDVSTGWARCLWLDNGVNERTVIIKNVSTSRSLVPGLEEVDNHKTVPKYVPSKVLYTTSVKC